ncbi:unnamed protein product [Closterium sp. Naga37s-1]|nr:unnamed protein product [Closterium sp. Naga37s-1]
MSNTAQRGSAVTKAVTPHLPLVCFSCFADKAVEVGECCMVEGRRTSAEISGAPSMTSTTWGIFQPITFQNSHDQL